MKPILLIFIFSLLSISCKKVKNTTNNSSTQNQNITLTNSLHERNVIIEKQINENQAYKNDLKYSFKLLTKDTIVENVFTNKKVEVELIKHLQIYVDNNLVQDLTNINEIALYYPENKKEGTIKLEDKNNDGFLDLWLEFTPQTKQYDLDYIIFLFEERESHFSKKREYLLKNLTEKEFKELYAPQE